MNPGEVYWADLGGGRRPIILVSREELNRGNYVVAILCTTARLTVRATLPNCVPFQAGQFGMPQDCVAQCETITFVDKADVDLATGVLGTLDDVHLREVVKAIGNVIGSDCEPV